MECLKEKIVNLYLELSYVRIEWELMKKIDDTINNTDEKIISKNEELIFALKDSIWYSIIMRIAKICENDTQVNSIYKIFNCCLSNPEVARKNIISEDELSKMRKNVEVAIYDESGENINLIKGWRDKYLAHYSKLENPQITQEEYLITRNKLNHIIETLKKILLKIIDKFNIEIDDVYVRAKIEALKNEFNIIYKLIETSIDDL